MHPHMIDQLASQHIDELRSSARAHRTHVDRHGPRNPIRHQAGWALVEIGLRLARDAGDA